MAVGAAGVAASNGVPASTFTFGWKPTSGMAAVGPAILHVRIDPQGQRKKQEFGFDPTGVLAKRALAKKRKELEQAVAQSKL